MYSYGLDALPTVADLDDWLDYVRMAEYAVRAGGPLQDDISD